MHVFRRRIARGRSAARENRIPDTPPRPGDGRKGGDRLIVPAGVLHPNVPTGSAEFRMARDGRFGNTLASPGNRAGPSGRTRLAAERDLDRIGEIDGLSFARTWDEMAFREAMKDLFLVYEEGEVQGFLVACAREAGNDGTILKVAVHPGQRGRGIASRLLEAAIREFRERRIREVDLDVEIVKTGVITLQGKFGFRVVRAVQSCVRAIRKSGFIHGAPPSPSPSSALPP